jgi:cell division protein FtsB
MDRRTDSTPTDDAPDSTGPGGSSGTRPASPADPSDAGPAGPNLAAFPVVGLTRRRTAAILGSILAVWIIIVFARQVSDASAASGRASQMAAANAARRADIADLQQELDLIAQKRYITQQARGYGLGTEHEIPFTLDPEAPPLDADAPGSESLRVGAPAPVKPLDRWLTLLFGPGG